MSSVKEELEQALKKGVEEGKIPHAVVYATNKDGSFQYSFATGKKNYSIDSEPINKDAIFQLCSQSKLLTSISALQLVEQGFIGLDDDVQRHIPEIARHGILEGFDEDDKPIIKDRKKIVTLRHLLTHSSGTNYAFSPDVQKYNKLRGKGGQAQDNAPTILERYDSPFMFEPGESWTYSPGLDWTGLLIHRLTSLTLDEWEKENIFKPLGIEDMTFWPSAESRQKLPTLVVRTPAGQLTPFNGEHINSLSTDCFGGHGVYAPLSSYLQIQKSLLANDGKLLTPQSCDLLFTNQISPQSEKDLNTFLSLFGGMIPGELNPTIPVQHSLGGIIFQKDDLGRRKAGTLCWGGLFNCFWIIDREADLAFTFGTQVLPPGDVGCKEMTGIAERAVYRMKGVKFD